MVRKWGIFLAVLIFSILFSWCYFDKDEDDRVITEMTAEEIVELLIDYGMPITEIVVHAEETDELLVASNQYTSRVDFMDDQSKHLFKGKLAGSVEVFNNAKEAIDRVKNLDGAPHWENPDWIPVKYIEQYENVVLYIYDVFLYEEGYEYLKAFRAIN